jgi:isochorismate hydrolase
MKKYRSPQEKKLLSYKKDCRNTYCGRGSNARHAIAAHKARDHRAYRRQINQILVVNEIHDANLLEAIDVEAKSVAESSWRKYPDEPLAEVLKRKLERQKYREIKKTFENKLNELNDYIQQGHWATIKSLVSMKKPALLIVYPTNYSYQSEQLNAQRTKLDELIVFAREKKFHIIWVLQGLKTDLSHASLEMRDENINMYLEGTPVGKIHEELERMKGEHNFISKNRYFNFSHKDLDNLLKMLNPAFIVLAGAHDCIRMAAVDVYRRNYRVQIISDCIASSDVRQHDVTFDYLGKGIAKVVNLAEFEEEFNVRH